MNKPADFFSDTSDWSAVYTDEIYAPIESYLPD